MADFTERVNALLSGRGWSRAELARRLDKPPQAVSRILNGESQPQRRTVMAFADALEVGPAALDVRFRNRERGRSRVLDRMAGIEVGYLGAAMRALARARRTLLEMSPAMAARQAEGKGDSLLFDSACENAIVGELMAFDDRAVVLSEERNRCGGDWTAAGTAYFIDPFDRSTAFTTRLKAGPDFATVADLVRDEEFGMRGAEAPFGSVTCVRGGQVAFNAMLDYAGGEVFVACPAMVQRGPVDVCTDPESLAVDGRRLHFERERSGTACACYLGIEGDQSRIQYEGSFRDMLGELQPFPADNLQRPGGPARVLYLSDDPTLTCGKRPAFALSNGEKITEWLGWLAYARYSQQLAVFELRARRFPFRHDVLLAPPPNYSVFDVDHDLDGHEATYRINLRRLASFDNPSIYRGGIAVAHRRSLVVDALRARRNKRELIAAAP